MMSEKSRQTEKVHFQFEINWKICVFSIVLFPVLLGLGFWQLNRAEEKRTIQQLVGERQAQPTRNLADLANGSVDIAELIYRKVSVTGELNSNYWMLENKTFQGRHGYQVVVPLRQQGGQNVLVNLGWVQGTGYRDRLPAVNLDASVIKITGRLTQPSVHPLLKGASDDNSQWPKLALQVEFDVMEEALGEPLFPLVLEIDPEHAQALKTSWLPVNVSPQKHLGYAYQWFSMSFVLLVLTLFANSNLSQLLKKRH